MPINIDCVRSWGTTLVAIIFCLFINWSALAQDSQNSPDSATSAAGGTAPTDPAAQAADAAAEPVDEALISQGKTLFNNNCIVCHQVHQQVVGPALASINERRPQDWLISFIRNSQKVIQSGDEYAVNLYNQYNKTVMPAFDFSDDEIVSILAYIELESETAPVAEAAEGGEIAGTEGGALPSSITNYLNAILIGILVVMVLILVVLVLLISVLSRYIKQKQDISAEERESIESGFDLKALIRSKAFIGLTVFIFTAIVTKSIIDGLYQIGVYTGYQPTQPVWFSHKIHAGQYQIQCQYCHTSVTESKSANIPSVNICMNCHNPNLGGIVQGAVYGEREISKVIEAWQSETPIEWVRVHNLPDLAYFNHAQHYNVGGIQCQTCHGPIEEMDVVYQYSNLTMGWCIECHRTTELNVKDNQYYDKLVELHADQGKDVLYVKDIGGLECSKCHY